MSQLVRLQVEIDQAHMEEIEELLRLGGLKTKRELLNNALTLLKWAVREKAKGNSICSASPNGLIQKELELPFLETVAATVHRAATTAAAEVNGQQEAQLTETSVSPTSTGALRLLVR